MSADGYQIRISPLMRRQLEAAAQDLGMSPADAARALLDRALAQHEARCSRWRGSGGAPQPHSPLPPVPPGAPAGLGRGSPAPPSAVIRTSGRLTEGQPLRGAPASTWTEEGPTWDGEIADAIAEKRARRRPTSGPIKDERAWRDRVEADLRAGPPGKVRELARAWHHRQEKDRARAEAAKAELQKREQLDRAEREELARRAEELRRRRGATRAGTGSGSTQSGGNGSRVESGRAKRLEPG